jgi:SAM-dependent methyltransferase
MRRRFPEVGVRYHTGDFTRSMSLPSLDGVVMANSLHFQSDQPAVLRTMRGYLRPGGRLVVVEYNTARANGAVPYPVPIARWERLASDAGFAATEVLVRRPSRYHGELYSAVSLIGAPAGLEGPADRDHS